MTIRTRAAEPPITLRIARVVYDEIRRTIGAMPAEQGGAIGIEHADADGFGDGSVVRYFRFDETARRTGATYSPDHQTLNEMFRWDWNPRQVRLAGFVHSHPVGVGRPSLGDLEYAARILDAIPDLPFLLVPIVLTEPDTGRFQLLPYAAVPDPDADGHSLDGHDLRVMRLRLELIDDPPVPALKPVPEPGREEERGRGRRWRRQRRGVGQAFARVGDVYDLERMATTRVVVVGVGGAAGFVEDLARAGVGQFVLIDHDLVTEPNLATQQVYRRDLGRAKVDALAERLWDINPAALVLACRASLDEFDDAEAERLCRKPLGGAAPAVTLLGGLTDNFFAQARVNALALQFGLPSLCAQVYQQGRAAEITFTYPGVTPACHRCILSSRYRAYLAEGYRNTVSSQGAPIFATTRLNALKGFIALALLHHPEPESTAADAAAAAEAATPHSRFTTLLRRIGNRNLVQLRLDPDLATSLGLGVFDRVFGGGDTARILFDEAVWLPQQPEAPTGGFAGCPDCGGTGDLRNAIGTFDDTRLIRPGEQERDATVHLGG